MNDDQQTSDTWMVIAAVLFALLVGGGMLGYRFQTRAMMQSHRADVERSKAEQFRKKVIIERKRAEESAVELEAAKEELEKLKKGH